MCYCWHSQLIMYAGGILRKAPKFITGLLRGLLRDITDITGFYYGYYGTFCVHFQWFCICVQKSDKFAPVYIKIQLEWGQILRILRILRFITENPITVYYRTLQTRIPSLVYDRTGQGFLGSVSKIGEYDQVNAWSQTPSRQCRQPLSGVSKWWYPPLPNWHLRWRRRWGYEAWPQPQ